LSRKLRANKHPITPTCSNLTNNHTDVLSDIFLPEYVNTDILLVDQTTQNTVFIVKGMIIAVYPYIGSATAGHRSEVPRWGGLLPVREFRFL